MNLLPSEDQPPLESSLHDWWGEWLRWRTLPWLLGTLFFVGLALSMSLWLLLWAAAIAVVAFYAVRRDLRCHINLTQSFKRVSSLRRYGALVTPMRLPSSSYENLRILGAPEEFTEGIDQGRGWVVASLSPEHGLEFWSKEGRSPYLSLNFGDLHALRNGRCWLKKAKTLKLEAKGKTLSLEVPLDSEFGKRLSSFSLGHKSF